MEPGPKGALVSWLGQFIRISRERDSIEHRGAWAWHSIGIGGKRCRAIWVVCLIVGGIKVSIDACYTFAGYRLLG